MTHVTIVLAAGLASLGLQGVLLPFLRRYLMDVPNGRSSHLAPTARGGGIAVVAGTWLGVVAGWIAGLPVPWLVAVVALGFFALLGLLDDAHGLGVMPRLSIQVGVALWLALWILWSRTDLVGLSLAGGIVVAAIWLAGFTNAYKFMDGINGISALNAVVAGGWYAYVGWNWDVPQLPAFSLAVAGAAAGFLPWNLPRARVFLGDVGSYAIGMSLASLALWALVAGVPLWTAFAPLLVYVLDTGWTLARRILSGRPWWEAHREHVYQRLVDGGWSHAHSSLVSAVAALLCCAAATVTSSVGVIVGALILLIGAGCYLLLPRAIHGARADTEGLTRP